MFLCGLYPIAGKASEEQNKAVQNAIETIEVQGQKNKKFIELASIQEQLNRVAGGTNLVDVDTLVVDANTLAKLLNFEAGIVIQEFFGGNDQPRINIRGSGIQDNPVNRGIQLLRDGMPLNQADGSFIIGLFDIEQAKYAQVYRGANAMRYGGTTLGGAINLTSRAQHNSDPQLLVEVGSFGRKKLSFQTAFTPSSGAGFGYINCSQSDGWRSNAQAQRSALGGNYEFEWQGGKNNFRLDVIENKFHMPFLLTKAMSQSHPNYVMGQGQSAMDELLNITVRKPNRETSQWRLANQSQFSLGKSDHQLGVYYAKTQDMFRNPLTHIETAASNFGLEYDIAYRYYLDNESFLDANWFLSANTGKLPRHFDSLHPLSGEKFNHFANIDLTAKNLVAGTELNYQTSSDWLWHVALQYVDNQRVIKDLLTQNLLDSDFSYQALNPKLGVNYQYSDEVRFYANVSYSSEAPNFWQLATVHAHPHDPLNDHVKINPLSMQTAMTYEIGSQGDLDDFRWQISGYQALVDDELIAVVGDFAVNGQTVNYQGQTIHNGLELMLAHSWQRLWSKQDKLDLKWVYNFSDFYFAEGQYHTNQLAGIPKHFLQTQLQYQHNAWQLALQHRWQPQSTFVDHLNTTSLQQDPYQTTQLAVRYQYSQTMSLYFEINNIFDENYQSAYAIRGHSEAEMPIFIPGIKRSMSANIKVNW